MRLLVDTHILVWLMKEQHRVTVAERALLSDPDNVVAASVVSLWEMRLKWGRYHASGERKGPVSPADLLDWLRSNTIEVLDLRAEVTVAELAAPLDHTDPFDLLLLIQAQAGGYRLLTRDAKLAAHPLALEAT